MASRKVYTDISEIIGIISSARTKELVVEKLRILIVQG